MVGGGRDGDGGGVAAGSRTRWAPIADRLNPNRPAFDRALKTEWKTMPNAKKMHMLAADRREIAALKTRGATTILPFVADPDDHCETSPSAYTHVASLLRLLAHRLGKPPGELRVYDPYFCAGGAGRHLRDMGFERIYNEPEDFYAVIAEGRVPDHDCVITNPPYSGDHFDRLLDFIRENRKPYLLLLPEHFSRRPAYAAAAGESGEGWLRPVFLTAPERYHYWTPEGLRPEEDAKGKHKNLQLGTRNSPFASHWFVSLAPTVPNAELLGLRPPALQLLAGCQLHGTAAKAEAKSAGFGSTTKNQRKADATAERQRKGEAKAARKAAWEKLQLKGVGATATTTHTANHPATSTPAAIAAPATAVAEPAADKVPAKPVNTARAGRDGMATACNRCRQALVANANFCSGCGAAIAKQERKQEVPSRKRRKKTTAGS